MKYTLLLLLLTSSITYAQQRHASWEQISRHDTNDDGKVTKEEFKGPERAFTRFDTNKDDSITVEEMKNIKPRGGKRGKKPDTAPQVESVAPPLKAQKLNSKDMIDLGNIKKTTVLIFGSYTWGPFSREVGQLQTMYEQNKDSVDFYLIYTKEAHASDSRRPNKSVSIKNHTNLAERSAAANSCLQDLKINIPTLLDDMQDRVASAYSAHPDRLFIIGADGKIAYCGEKGPRGFNASEMEKALKTITK